MDFKLIVIAVLLVAVNARPQEDVPAEYQFKWLVEDPESANTFGHEEERNGDLTNGVYYVALPDGRMQRVAYVVDLVNGYQADVTYTKK